MRPDAVQKRLKQGAHAAAAATLLAERPRSMSMKRFRRPVAIVYTEHQRSGCFPLRFFWLSVGHVPTPLALVLHWKVLLHEALDENVGRPLRCQPKLASANGTHAVVQATGAGRAERMATLANARQVHDLQADGTLHAFAQLGDHHATRVGNILHHCQLPRRPRAGDGRPVF